MYAKEEPNCLFGGMAVPPWQNLDGQYGNDDGKKGNWINKVFSGDKKK